MMAKRVPMALLVLFLMFLGAFGEEFPSKEFLELLQPTVEKCETETGVDKGLVDKFSNGEMVEDDKLKCYMKCMFVELNLLETATGSFRFERMLNLIPQDMKLIAYEMGKNCLHFKGEAGADLCQVSFDLHRCWQSKDPKHYFLV